MIGVMALTHALDAGSFLLAYNKYGIRGNELFPFPEAMYRLGGIEGVLAMKALGVIAIVFLLIRWQRGKYPWPTVARYSTYSTLLAGLAGLVVNTWSLLI